MKRVFLHASAAFALLALGSSSACAQPAAADAEKTDLAGRLVTVLDMQGAFKSMVGRSMESVGEQSGFDPRSQAQQQAAAQSFNASLAVAVNESKPGLVAAAARVYTLDELRAAVSFYESPVGRSFNAKSQQLGQAMSPLVLPALNRFVGAWQADYCRRVTCTAGEHSQFAAMSRILSQPQGGPPRGQPQGGPPQGGPPQGAPPQGGPPPQTRQYQGAQYEGAQYQDGPYQGGQGPQQQGAQYQGAQYQGAQYQGGQYQGGQPPLQMPPPEPR